MNADRTLQAAVGTRVPPAISRGMGVPPLSTRPQSANHGRDARAATKGLRR
jgi:hypothetical protein